MESACICGLLVQIRLKGCACLCKFSLQEFVFLIYSHYSTDTFLFGPVSDLLSHSRSPNTACRRPQCVCVYVLHSSSVLRLEDKAQSSAVKTVTPHTLTAHNVCVFCYTAWVASGSISAVLNGLMCHWPQLSGCVGTYSRQPSSLLSPDLRDSVGKFSMRRATYITIYRTCKTPTYSEYLRLCTKRLFTRVKLIFLNRYARSLSSLEVGKERRILIVLSQIIWHFHKCQKLIF